MTEQALIPRNGGQSALAHYGTNVELKEMVNRISGAMLINAKGDKRKFQPREASLLAMSALAHGLSPFNGEVQLLLDSDGYPVIYYSPEAYLKAARAALEKEGGGNID